LLIKIPALPYIKETDTLLLSDPLKERVMGKGLAQKFGDSKSLQRVHRPVEAFFFKERDYKQRKV
jgi:hypothetical protein